MFNIAFFSSSDFTIPLLDILLQAQDTKLRDIVQYQLEVFSDEKLIQLFNQNIDLSELEEKVNLQLVVSQPSSELRGKLIDNPIVKYAKDKQLSFFTPDKINRSVDEFRNLSGKLDLVLVASFGQIISQQVLDWPKSGFINWHPSKLPKYRGATPVQSTLKSGETKTALTWLQMTKDMDAGDILLQIEAEISRQTNFNTLINQMGLLGAKAWAIAAWLQILVKQNKFIPAAQDESQVTFCQMLSKEDKIVDPKIQTAEEIFNQYRAFIRFPGTSFEDEYFQGEVKLLEVTDYLGAEQFLELTNLGTILATKNRWTQIKLQSQVQTFLQCLEGYLEVGKVGLSSGKQIDLRGFEFK